MSRKRRAELVFYQLSDRWSDENQNWIGRWVGRLLAADNCIDQATGLPVTWNPYWLIEEHPDGHFNVELQAVSITGAAVILHFLHSKPLKRPDFAGASGVFTTRRVK